MKVGITGHQSRAGLDWAWLRESMRLELTKSNSGLEGLSSLAAGTDQLFAEIIKELRGDIIAVIPCSNYISLFSDKVLQSKYRLLLQDCKSVIQLPDKESSEASFNNAGQYIVQNVDVMFAAWDGKPSLGLGGTGDIVAFAIKARKPVYWLDPIKKKVEWIL